MVDLSLKVVLAVVESRKDKSDHVDVIGFGFVSHIVRSRHGKSTGCVGKPAAAADLECHTRNARELVKLEIQT